MLGKWVVVLYPADDSPASDKGVFASREDAERCKNRIEQNISDRGWGGYRVCIEPFTGESYTVPRF